MDTQAQTEVDRLRDLLAEARRYVRSNPEVADDFICRFRNQLQALRPADAGLDEIAYRLACNLDVGTRFMRAAPYVLEGYIDGASWELLAAMGRRQESIA